MVEDDPDIGAGLVSRDDAVEERLQRAPVDHRAQLGALDRSAGQESLEGLQAVREGRDDAGLLGGLMDHAEGGEDVAHCVTIGMPKWANTAPAAPARE